MAKKKSKKKVLRSKKKARKSNINRGQTPANRSAVDPNRGPPMIPMDPNDGMGPRPWLGPFEEGPNYRPVLPGQVPWWHANPKPAEGEDYDVYPFPGDGGIGGYPGNVGVPPDWLGQTAPAKSKAKKKVTKKRAKAKAKGKKTVSRGRGSGRGRSRGGRK